MKWDRADLEAFFDRGGELQGIERPPGSTLEIFVHEGPHLKYWLTVDEAEGQVAISGDPAYPFGGDSLFEIYVPCTEIRRCKDVYYEHQWGLRFFDGDPDEWGTMVLTILKNPDGELKVWSTVATDEARNDPPPRWRERGDSPDRQP